MKHTKPSTKRWTRGSLETHRDRSIDVVEPSVDTEFEVQARIWSGLRGLGINARGEVKTCFRGRATVRFDVAVFEAGKLVGLIECKREGKQADTEWMNTRQGSRYAQFGVPVRLAKGMDDAERLLIDASEGRLWAQPP